MANDAGTVVHRSETAGLIFSNIVYRPRAVRDSVFMAAISPARHAGNIKRPLLVVQGASDPIVPPAESEDIVRLVRANGGTAEYLLFPDEGHGLSKEQDYVKAFEKMLDFLRTYMPPPR